MFRVNHDVIGSPRGKGHRRQGHKQPIIVDIHDTIPSGRVTPTGSRFPEEIRETTGGCIGGYLQVVSAGNGGSKFINHLTPGGIIPTGGGRIGSGSSGLGECSSDATIGDNRNSGTGIIIPGTGFTTPGHIIRGCIVKTVILIELYPYISGKSGGPTNFRMN